jgi:hypothetical protein
MIVRVPHDETPEQRMKRQEAERDARIAACPVKETDLLSISRGTDKCRSYVTMEWDWETQITWLKFGEATLRTNDRRDGKWTLEARMGHGACDPEHDTAFALRLPLIGVEFEWADHHMFRFHGFVEPGLDPNDRHNTFHVPPPGYDPTKHPKAETCNGKYDGKKNWCKWGDGKKHIIVPEGFYVPPFDPELYKLVAGKRIQIMLGKSHDKDEEDD